MTNKTERITPKVLASIQVLWRQPDTMALYGIPYGMRPGQSPHHIREQFRGDWLWLGSPGWWGTMSSSEQARVKEFLAKQSDLPEGPNEWMPVDPVVPAMHHATKKKKSPAQLQREIDEVLAKKTGSTACRCSEPWITIEHPQPCRSCGGVVPDED